MTVAQILAWIIAGMITIAIVLLTIVIVIITNDMKGK